MMSIAGAITMLAGAILCIDGIHAELYATRNVAYLVGSALILLGLVVFVGGMFSSKKEIR